MKRPILKSYQFVVGHAESSTGHVLTTDKTLFLGSGDVFLVFDSESEANNYIRQTVNEGSNIECWLEDNSGKHLGTFDQNGERKKHDIN